MKIDEQTQEKIINFGAFEYKIDKMANVLGLPVAEVEAEFNNENSDFYKFYRIGKDRADYVLDLKLFDMAKAGDLKALDKFEDRKFTRNNNR